MHLPLTGQALANDGQSQGSHLRSADGEAAGPRSPAAESAAQGPA